MDIDIIQQEAVSMTEMKEKLDKLKEKRKELNFRATKVHEYLEQTSELKKEQADELKKKIDELQVPRIKEKHIIKIIDIMPRNVEELKSLLSGENVTVKAEDLNKILSALQS